MPMVRLTADTKDTSRRRPTTGCWRHSETRTSLSLRPSRNVVKNLCKLAGTGRPLQDMRAAARLPLDPSTGEHWLRRKMQRPSTQTCWAPPSLWLCQ